MSSMTLLTPLALAIALAAVAPASGHGDKTAGKAAVTAAADQQDWGIAGAARAATRTVHIRMSDRMRFTPERLQVQQGQTLKLVIHNDGRMQHEFVLGTAQALREHAALMLKHPDMEHDEAYMAHVAPGHSGQIIWTFNRAGTFEFACLVAGHYQAGMVGSVVVSSK